MDGHTRRGAYKITVTLTKDQVDQLIRSMEWAKMMDSHTDNPPDFPQRLDVMAHRAFLQEILNIMYEAIIKQRRINEGQKKPKGTGTAG